MGWGGGERELGESVHMKEGGGEHSSYGTWWALWGWWTLSFQITWREDKTNLKKPLSHATGRTF